MYRFDEKGEAWTPTPEEEELAYREFLEACKTYPKEGFLTPEQIDRAHRRIFGEPVPASKLRYSVRKISAIAVAAAVIAASTVTAAAFQNQLRRFFLRESPIATDVEVIPPDDEENSETIAYYWDAAYIPEGYVLDYTDISELGSVLDYRDQDGTGLCIFTMPLNNTPSIDTEDTQKQEIEVAGGSGYLYTTQDDSKTVILLLYKDGFLAIGGKISQEEMLKIADSLYQVNISTNQEELQ